MSITDELREWVTGAKPAVVDGCSISVGTMTYGCKKALLAIADRIDAEHEKACDDAWDNGYEADYLGIEKWLTEHPQVMEHHGWVRLPLDADGVPIHIGDVIAYEDNTKPKEVVALVPPSVVMVEDGPRYADMCRHYHEPTVEDVLRDVVTLCHNTWKEGLAFEFYDVDDVMKSSNIVEYAAKLRLVGDDE